MNAIIDHQLDVEILKKHYPTCAKIFDMITEKKRSEQEYKEMKKKEEQKWK